jgi:hypothetical protein
MGLSDAVYESLIDYNRLIHVPINRFSDYLAIIAEPIIIQFSISWKKMFPKGFYTGIPVKWKPNTQTQSTADFFFIREREREMKLL